MKAGATLVLAVIVTGFIILGLIVVFLDYESKLPTGDVVSAPAAAGEHKIVTKIIDGDTVVVQGGDHVRLLGMDSDEKGDPCFKAASDRIKELVLNKQVYLEPDAEDKDQYGRLLRYLILDGKNINVIMVQEGLAVARFYPENTKYKAEITAAEEQAIANKVGCKWKDS